MKEIREIIKSYEACKNEGKKCALATVVHVEGSAYRRPGARMLITENGKLTGAISGGCLEGDALKKALLVINSSLPSLVTYDTMDEDDATIGVGLGCNGIIKVLIEPLNFDNLFNPIEMFKQINSERKEKVLVSIFCPSNVRSSYVGTKMLIGDQGSIMGEIDDIEYTNEALKRKEEILRDRKSLWLNMTFESVEYQIFYEYIEPTILLNIVGAGNDVKPLVEMAKIIGWDCNIIDGRHNYATYERFPEACNIVVNKPDLVLDQITIDHRTVFVLMTHNYNYDKAMLRQLVEIDSLIYIGMLGPKKKFDRIINEFMDVGIILSDEQRDKIFSPVGLNIGAETSEEIALSIMAEIKAITSERKGLPLRLIEHTIH